MSSKRCDAEKKIAFQDAALVGQGQMCINGCGDPPTVFLKAKSLIYTTFC